MTEEASHVLSAIEQGDPSAAEQLLPLIYDELRSCPTGSGVVEGACSHVVKDRMEQAGMRWQIEGAQAILNLRAIYVNDDWGAFHAVRIQTEQHKLHACKRRLLTILNCAT